MSRLFRLPLLLLLSILAGCSEELPPAPSTPASPHRVIETFEVGQDVYVRSLAIEGARNTLWVGTSVGVMEIDLANQALRNSYNREHGLANEYVFGIFVDSRGNKWFGTNGGGVSRFKDGQWQTYFPLHGLADYWVYTFAEQADGTLWIGTWAGANSLSPAGGFKTYVKELVNEWVYGLAVDSRQRVWFGTEGGVSMFDGKQWQEWTHEDGLGAANTAELPPSGNTGLGTRSRHDLSTLQQGSTTYNRNYVFAILVDPHDQVWAGTWGGGVARWDGTHWTNFTTADGLAGNIVYSIARDQGGALWFGTDRGLTRWDGTQWTSYTRADGLLGDHVYAIAVTQAGEIWAGTRGGVTRLGRQAPATTNTTRGNP